MSFKRKMERNRKNQIKKVFITSAKAKTGINKETARAYFEERYNFDKKKEKKKESEI